MRKRSNGNQGSVRTTPSFVADWGGFEELVAKLHDTGSVTVARNVVLHGQSGAPRQIDVLLTRKDGLYEHRVLIECKHWNRSVQRAQVDQMCSAVRDLSAAKGVIFTTKGYQSGAETMARASGVEIFVVREMTAEEWGLPGRTVELYIQLISRALGNFEFPGAKGVLVGNAATDNEPMPVALSSVVGPTGFLTSTPVLNPAGKLKTDTLENILDLASQQAAQELTKKTVTFNGGENCTVYLMGHLCVPFDPPLQVQRGGRPCGPLAQDPV